MRSSDYTFVTVRKKNSASFYLPQIIFPKEKRWGLFYTCILEISNCNSKLFRFTFYTN